MRKSDFAYVKTKVQISYAITAQLINAIVFPTKTVQCLYILAFHEAVQPDLYRTWLKTQKTGFLVMQLNYLRICQYYQLLVLLLSNPYGTIHKKSGYTMAGRYPAHTLNTFLWQRQTMFQEYSSLVAWKLRRK